MAMVRRRKETNRREAWDLAKQMQKMLGTLERHVLLAFVGVVLAFAICNQT